MPVDTTEYGRVSKQAVQPHEPHALLFNIATELDRLKRPLATLTFSAASLEREPENRELRSSVASSWAEVSSIIGSHSAKADHVLLEEAALHPGFRPQLIERLRTRVRRLHSLYSDIVKVSFETGTNAEVAEAARQVQTLAVVLDDIITTEEGDVLPMLRRVLFASKTH
jgi:hypothetical protein